MQGRKVRDNGPQEVWMKPLADGSRAVILFNRGNETGPVGRRLGGASACSREARPSCGTCGRRPTWDRSPDSFEAKVEPHDVVMVRITPQI